MAKMLGTPMLTEAMDKWLSIVEMGFPCSVVPLGRRYGGPTRESWLSAGRRQTQPPRHDPSLIKNSQFSYFLGRDSGGTPPVAR